MKPRRASRLGRVLRESVDARSCSAIDRVSQGVAVTKDHPAHHHSDNEAWRRKLGDDCWLWRAPGRGSQRADAPGAEPDSAEDYSSLTVLAVSDGELDDGCAGQNNTASANHGTSYACENSNQTNWVATSYGTLVRNGVTYETPGVYDIINFQDCGW